MSSIEDRLMRLETINEVYMEKIVKGLESVSVLVKEAEENEAFRKSFDEKTKIIINEKLNTIEFDKDLKQTIQNEVKIILESKDSSTEFDNRVIEIVSKENKKILLGVYIKITAIITTIASGVLIAFFKGKI